MERILPTITEIAPRELLKTTNMNSE